MAKAILRLGSRRAVPSHMPKTQSLEFTRYEVVVEEERARIDTGTTYSPATLTKGLGRHESDIDMSELAGVRGSRNQYD
jgi:hypothetical protein